MKYFLLFSTSLLMFSCIEESCEFKPLQNGKRMTTYVNEIKNTLQADFDMKAISIHDTLVARLSMIDKQNTESKYPEDFLTRNNHLVNLLCGHVKQMDNLSDQTRAEKFYYDLVEQLASLDLSIVKKGKKPGKPKRETPCELPGDLRKPEISDKRKAVISIGAHSFDGFVVAIDNKKNWSNIAQYYQESLGLSNGINFALGKLEATIATIISEQSVKPEDIHLVFSSGLVSNNDQISTIKKGLENQGYIVHEVSCEEEAKYGYKTNVLKQYESRSFFVDIGSGNTKISWENQNGIIETYCATGSLYRSKGISDQEALSSFDGLDVLSNRTKYCFLIGGGPYKLASMRGHDDSDPSNKFFCLPDLDSYDETLLGSGRTLVTYKFIKRIKEKTRCENIIFISHSNFAIGKLLELDY